MGRSIPVKIDQTEFKSQKAAVDYFMDHSEAVKANGPLTGGKLFDELKNLYTRYCDVSPGWELNGRNIVSFVTENERRQNGVVWDKVNFTNGEKCPFSVDTAITALVNAENGAEN